MKRLALAVSLSAFASSAWAQNPTCPTRPSGDNSNACASTAFVQNAVGGSVPLTHTHIFVGNGSNIAANYGTLATFSDTGTLSLNPTTGFSLGYDIAQTLSGSTPPTQTGTFLGYAANRILVNNNSSYSSSIFGLHVELDTSLAGSSPGNAAGFFHTISGAASGSSGFAIGTTHYVSVETNWLGGTLGVPAGAAYGLSVYSRMGGAPIIHLLNLTGMEINPEAGGNASSTVDYKSGIQIALLQNDSHQGISFDAALSISNIAGSTTLGWRDGILFSNANGQQPLDATNGTLIKTRGAGTVLNGFDISSYTITGSAFKSTGFNILGSGNVGIGTFTTPDSQITINNNSAASVAPIAANSLHLVGANANNNSFTMDAYAGQNLIMARTAEGTLAAKTATVLNRSLLQIAAQGWDGSAYASGANFIFSAGELWSGTAHGAYIKLSTTPLTTTTLAEAVRIQPSGALSVGALAIATDPGIGKINANSLVLQGATSGTVTQSAQAIAGTPAITWGTTSGTPAVTASGPLAITAATGNITCAGCLSNTPAALTKVDDTNVTLTLGGTPSTALLQAVSITAGWTGTLANARLATMATNTVKGNATSGTASPTDLAVGTCSTSTSALIWTTNTGFGCNTFGTIATQAASSVAITGGTIAGLTGLAIRDTSAAFDVTIAATSSGVLSAGRTLTLNMGNVAHTLALGTTANTITFPNAASFTVAGLSIANSFTAQQTITATNDGLTSLSGNAGLTGGISVGRASLDAYFVGVGAAVQFNPSTLQGDTIIRAASRLLLDGSNGGTGAVVISATNTITLPNVASDTAATDNTLCITSAGLVLKGSGTLGICLGTSSERYKNRITDLKDGIAEIMQLRPVNFYYNKDMGHDARKIQFGFTAEQVYPILPALVDLDDKHRPNTVDILGMFPIMVKAIQDLKGDNDNLRSQLVELRKRK